MKRLIALLMLLLIPSLSYADISHMTTNIDVSESESKFRTRILFDEPPTGRWEYNLLFGIENFEYTSSMGGECTSLRKSFGSSIVCEFPETAGIGRNLVLRFTTDELVTNINGNGESLFSVDIKAPQNVTEMVTQVTLGRGLVVAPEGGYFVPFTPVDGQQGTDGRQIFIVWRDHSIPRGEGISVDVVFEKAVEESPQVNIALIVVGSVVLLIVLLMSLLAYFRKGTLPMLRIDEEKVVGILKENHGMAKQNALVRETGFSKAKMSRLIKDMEERGIVHTKHVGRNNEVYLGKMKRQKPEGKEK